MEVTKLVNYVENSFLKELLTDEQITDISFNGSDIYYVHNEKGRRKSNIVINQADARDFLRQIANICEKQFSHQSPVLDVNFGKYRVNAVHSSIGVVGDEDSYTFSMRIASYKPRITDSSTFINPWLKALFERLLNNGDSMVIGGVTGSGKTEFQKYLIRKMKTNTRVMIIDNIMELSQIGQDHLDVTCWKADDEVNSKNIQTLVRNALRSNPDWLIVAESRGGEMVEVLNSAMTGHPIITTLHAKDAEGISDRMVQMVMMNDKKYDPESIKADILKHFNYYIYLQKTQDEKGNVKRYIREIVYKDATGKSEKIYIGQPDGRYAVKQLAL